MRKPQSSFFFFLDFSLTLFLDYFHQTCLNSFRGSFAISLHLSFLVVDTLIIGLSRSVS